MKSKDKYKYVIGLDLSLTEPGWAKYVIETKELTFGVIDVKKSKGMFRIQEILDGVSDLLAEPYFIHDETLIIIEGYSFASKGNSAISLGELGGVIRHYFWCNQIDYFECAPTQAKKFLTGKGVADKAIIIKEVYKNYGIDTNNDNAADAINLCYIGRAVLDCSNKQINSSQKLIAEKIIEEK